MNPTAILALALLCPLSPISFADEPNKVFILAGQSDMEGQGLVDHDYNGGKGNLVWSMVNSKSADKMRKLKNEKGEWVVRDDVQISFKVGGDKILKGGLSVGYTGYAADRSRRHMGPELGFGFVMGDHFKEPVLLIKTAWGGKSLYTDFRPPSSGGQVGPCYTKMVEEVRAALAELGTQKYEIAGFYWQQGWNDMCEAPAIPEYAQNLVNLVKDLRKEFNVPNMPVVVGQLGNGGPVTEGAMFEFRKAQEEGTKQIKLLKMWKNVLAAYSNDLYNFTGQLPENYAAIDLRIEGISKADKQKLDLAMEEVFFSQRQRVP